jgi:DNA-directed RNA polymerase specialized sigma24 family protein
MEIHWTYEGCDDQEIGRLATYWARVQSELAAKTAELDDTPSQLRLAVERDDSEDNWLIQAALHLPGNTLVAESAARTPERALDQVLHSLAVDIDQLLRDEKSPAPPLRREGLDEVVALLEGCRSPRQRSQAFISFLSPLVSSLMPYVHRELRIREYEGTLEGEAVAPADVLDDVIVAAWERFPQRNKSLPLDLWLVQLADESLQRLSGTLDQASLEDESVPDPSGDEESSWVDFAELATASESSELRELLPGQPSANAWDELDLETKQSHLAEMLAGLPRERRQAFVLNTVHGFNSAEIADFQGREVGEVEQDIAGAIATVQRNFNAERSPDMEEPFIRRELRQFRRKRH